MVGMLERLFGGATRTVLMVSSDEPDQSLNGAFLHRPPIRLLVGRPDERTLRLARRKHPSLIIDDLQAPGDDSAVDFCRSLRQDPATRSIPLMVVAPPALDDRARRCQPTLLLTKPVGRYEFFRAVRRFVPMPARRSARYETNLRFCFRSPELSGQAFSRDVSLVGAFLKTDRLPRHGSRLELAFRLPGDDASIRCRATVVRTAQAGGPCAEPENGFAVEFEELTDADVAHIERYVEHLVGRRRGMPL
jgi:CheY-like chemotaxis protein